MSHNPSRRMFLRGRFSARPQHIRPPWALAEEAFLSACSRCAECITACPEHILEKDESGYPKVSFALGECTFCGECVTRCAPRALVRQEGQSPWSVKALIGEGCIAKAGVVCRACGDTCPAQAIRFHPELRNAAQPALDPQVCTGCGACFIACPARAITLVQLGS